MNLLTLALALWLASTLALAFRLRKAPPLRSNKADRLPCLTCPSK